MIYVPDGSERAWNVHDNKGLAPGWHWAGNGLAQGRHPLRAGLPGEAERSFDTLWDAQVCWHPKSLPGLHKCQR